MKMLNASKKSKKYKKQFRPYDSRGIRSDHILTECYCPKCESIHIMKIHWIGRGTPKKFCEHCKKTKRIVTCEIDVYVSDYSQMVD